MALPFETKQLPFDPDVTAPDGSDVRVLLGVPGGSLAHFTLPPSATPLAAVGVTMPPWPGDGEAEHVAGVWEPTVSAPRK